MRVSAKRRRAIFNRAGDCCEYCRIGAGEQWANFHIDHIIARSHDGDDSDENLCLACPDCNTRKGPNVAAFDPATGRMSTLFHPRLQNWEDHFQIRSDATIVGLTPEGRTTASLLRMNDEVRVLQRYRESLIGNYPCQTDR